MSTIAEIVNSWYAAQMVSPPVNLSARKALIEALEAKLDAETRRAHSDGFQDGYREAVADEDKVRPRDMRKALDEQGERS